MPMTIQVTGLASRAAVKLHTEPISGASAPFANRNPALSILEADAAGDRDHGARHGEEAADRQHDEHDDLDELLVLLYP